MIKNKQRRQNNRTAIKQIWQKLHQNSDQETSQIQQLDRLPNLLRTGRLGEENVATTLHGFSLLSSVPKADRTTIVAGVHPI